MLSVSFSNIAEKSTLFRNISPEGRGIGIVYILQWSIRIELLRDWFRVDKRFPTLSRKSNLCFKKSSFQCQNLNTNAIPQYFALLYFKFTSAHSCFGRRGGGWREKEFNKYVSFIKCYICLKFSGVCEWPSKNTWV